MELEELKKRIDIVELARHLGIEVLPNGKQAHCFNRSAHKHGDKTPSLSFTTRNGEGFFKCFSCNIYGDIFNLYALYKGITLGEAIKDLKATIDYSTKGLQGPARVADTKKEVAMPIIATPNIRKTYRDFYNICYKNYTREGLFKLLKYLKGEYRGLSNETIAEFGLFWIPEGIADELKKETSQENLEEAGLFKGNYFRFSKYEVGIPYLEAGEIVYIKARRLDGGNPKYMQVAGLSIPLFNSDILKTMDRLEDLYICEGEFDTMIAIQNGLNAVGVVGVNGLTGPIVEMLKGFNVYLAFDNDDKGQEAIDREVTGLRQSGVNVLGKLDLEGSKDLTEFYLK